MRMPNHEQALRRQGVEWEYVEGVTIEQINHTRGKQLQARLEPLDQTLVDNYMEMVKDGSEPPPLLLWKHGRGLYVPLDGNQRVQAMLALPKKYRMPFSAYVIGTADPMIVDRLCWQFNNMINGRRLSYDESMSHAVTYCRKYNASMSEAAKQWGVKHWELVARINEMELRELAAKKSVDLSRVPRDTVARLSPLVKIGEDVFAKAADVVAKSGIGCQVVQEMVQAVAKARNHDDKITAIETFSFSEPVIRSRAETMNGKHKPSNGRLPQQQLQLLLDRLEDVCDAYEDAALRPRKEDRQRYAAEALKVCNRLIGIYGLGRYLEGQGVA